MNPRLAFVLSTLILAWGTIAFAEVTSDDPIGMKLSHAKISYTREITKFNEEFEKAFESKLADARKAGKQETVDDLKAELDAFKKTGVVPSNTPVAVRRKRTVIRGKMESAYETAIKGYTKSGNDSIRKQLESELKLFQLPDKIVAIKADLVGTWNMKVGDWSTDVIFNENGTAKGTTHQITGVYVIDLDAETVKITWEKDWGWWVHKLPLDPKGTASSSSGGHEFKIVKQK